MFLEKPKKTYLKYAKTYCPNGCGRSYTTENQDLDVNVHVYFACMAGPLFGEFECEFCPEQFGTIGSFENHIKRWHSSIMIENETNREAETEFTCPICRDQFNCSREQFGGHLKEFHSKQFVISRFKPHIACLCCEERFYTFAKFKAHYEEKHAASNP